jgi:ketosteroid isomerase-like protein
MPSAKMATPVLQGFLDAFNAHDVDAIMSFFAEDCVLDMPRGARTGRTAAGGQAAGSGRDPVPA